jgi:hypothetical protein
MHSVIIITIITITIHHHHYHYPSPSPSPSPAGQSLGICAEVEQRPHCVLLPFGGCEVQSGLVSL